MRILRSFYAVTFFRKAAGLALILLAYGGVFLGYYLIRYAPLVPTPFPFHPSDLLPLRFDQKVIGVSLQITVLPLLLLFLLSYIPYFRRLLQDQTSLHATWGVFLGVAALQVISQTYEIWLARNSGEPFFLGIFLILIGSLIGGWRIGLPLGAISLLYQSAFEHLTMTSMVSDIRLLGLADYLRHFQWKQFFLEGVLNPHFSCGIWAAVFASLAASFLGSRRYSPWAAGILGMVLEYAMGDLRYAAGVTSVLWGIPAQALVTGFTAAWVMLMIRTLQVEASRRKVAEAELARMQAELRALRAQINPHFFFNALNTIRFMIREDPQKARDLLIDLSEIFQRTLRSGDFVPLRSELGYVEAYFSLEKARLGDRLRVVWGGLLRPEGPLKTETPLLDHPVPTLTLQPIVENAVIHGIGKKKEGGTVSISVDRRQDDLVIVIEDDGVGMDPGRTARLFGPGSAEDAGIGLRNVDARLRQLYGLEYGLAVESEPKKGTRVTIRMPLGAEEDKP
jgi:LytS/YehU family sensor histidine kinase